MPEKVFTTADKYDIMLVVSRNGKTMKIASLNGVIDTENTGADTAELIKVIEKLEGANITKPYWLRVDDSDTVCPWDRDGMTWRELGAVGDGKEITYSSETEAYYREPLQPLIKGVKDIPSHASNMLPAPVQPITVDRKVKPVTPPK